MNLVLASLITYVGAVGLGLIALFVGLCLVDFSSNEGGF